MGMDQRHEQLNADIKGPGGAIGLMEMMKSFFEGCSVHQRKEEWFESLKKTLC